MQLQRVTDGDLPEIVDLINLAYRGKGAEAGWATERQYIEGERTTVALLKEDLAGSPEALLLMWRDEADGSACWVRCGWSRVRWVVVAGATEREACSAGQAAGANVAGGCGADREGERRHANPDDCDQRSRQADCLVSTTRIYADGGAKAVSLWG